MFVCFLGRGLCLLALLLVPVSVPAQSAAALQREPGSAVLPTSINLIVGAVSLLIVLMLVSSLALETTACALGVLKRD